MGLLFGGFCCFMMMMMMMGSDGTRVLSALKKSDTDDVTTAAALLMGFKRSSVVLDPTGFLSDWNSSNPCCSWRGVSCDASDDDNESPSSLDLTNAGLIGPLHLPYLTSLRRLFLHGNHFSAGDLSVSTARPCLVEIIDLSSNNLTTSPPFLLSSCHNLTSLNLSNNHISSSGNLTALNFFSPPSLLQLDLSNNLISHFQLSNNCHNLILLNFSHNNLTLSEFLNFSQCNNLSVLDLSHNNFSGTLQFGHKCPPNLTLLNLSHNTLSGDIGFLTNCQLLETLDLSHNQLRFQIPGVLLGNLNNLRRLSLANNLFYGEIPPELGNTCGTLEDLDLSGNKLTGGGFPLNFASCSSLRTLNLGNNQLYYDGDYFITTVISHLPSLRYLYLPFNNLSGPVPLSSLLTNSTQQQLLQVLDLSSNAFTGTIPPSAFNFCHKLEKLLLPNNFLSGPIPAELGNCKNLISIDLSFNCLSGPIPSQIWNLPNLSELVMWANNLSGEIPQGICEDGGGNLEMLILNNNLITGTIPPSIAKCTDLIWVSLSNNHLTGDIPDGIGHLLNLAILQLGNNSLSGKIPPELGNCRSLIWLDLNSNNLSGSVPLELANQAGLVTPGLVSGKQFAFVRNEGGTACRGAGGLVEFEGVRPGRLASHPMVHSCVSTRIYTGLTVYSFTSNGTMIYLDLSYNALTGLIPDNFGSMNYLQVLNLGHNMISGKIPDSFGGLKAIGVLDLSHNYLQGFVPGSLGTLSFLSDLDVSNNNLTGLIPTGGQLTTFPASRYENNSGLCGLPLPPCSSGSRGRPTSFRARGEKQSMAAAEMVIGITVSLLCILGLTFALYRMKKRRRQVEEKRDKYIESLPSSGSSSWKLSSVPEPSSINVATFEKPLQKLTFAHLLEATNGFSSDTLIGSGGFGEVYKAQLSDGCVVAIKKLIHVTGQGDREFMAEMETIGKIKHRNLVPLLGYCKIGEERLLVYEYMKWGSLEAVLHDRAKAKGGGGSKLDWSARKKISIGSARGLAFLHHSCIPHIIHRDMKSSNVLLDENFEARVSDFGMARLVNALDTHLSVSTLAGTPGYVPPEYYQSFRCTTKGDVYSYGVILLELLAGKRPIDPLEFGDDNNLVGWAKQLQRENRSNEILDPELVTQKSGEAELYQYLKIAFECLEDRPFRRPTMIQVMAMFKELQIDTENDILDGFSVKETVIEESREKEVSS